MDILKWFNPARWIMLIAAVGSLVLGYNLWASHQQGIGEDRANARWQIATNQLKLEARAKLTEEADKARAAEKTLQDFKNQQELKDENNQNTVARLSRSLRELASASGNRLHDPNAKTGCGGGSGSTESRTTSASNAGTSDGTKTGGLLSEQLSELLLQRLDEADTINNAYIACRADTYKIRAVAR
jgi:hypothetical protein